MKTFTPQYNATLCSVTYLSTQPVKFVTKTSSGNTAGRRHGKVMTPTLQPLHFSVTDSNVKLI